MKSIFSVSNTELLGKINNLGHSFLPRQSSRIAARPSQAGRVYSGATRGAGFWKEERQRGSHLPEAEEER